MFVELIVLLALILLNAFFAASEMALVSLNDTKIRLMAEEGDKKAMKLRDLLGEPSKFLSTIQIGITLAGLLSSAFASETFADRLVKYIQDLGLTASTGLIKPVVVVLITLILSYFTLVFGELVPKRLAMQSAERLAMRVVDPLRFLSVITAPLVKLLTVSTNFFIRVFGGNPNADEEEVTEEEIRMMIDVGEEKGTIDEIEKEFINNIFDFDDKVVSEIMTHRTQIAALPVDADLSELIDLIRTEKYTRIPVYEESIDNIIGILHVKDIIQFLAAGNTAEFDMRKLIRAPYFVPESKKLNELFQELQIKKIHMVVVIDEYGGTAGIITIEDLLEEIVGNIFDEYDIEETEFEKVDDSTYIFNGSISLDKVQELIGIDLPVDDYETLSGFLISQLGKIPGEEEKPVIELDNIVFRVEKVEEKRIARIKVCTA